MPTTTPSAVSAGSPVEIIDKLEQIRARLVAGSTRPLTSPPPPARPAPRPAHRTREDLVVRPPRQTWLWVLTAISSLVFLVGAGLTIVDRVRAAEPSALASPRPDGGPVALAPPVTIPDAQAPEPPAPPEGMLLVRDAAGKPSFFVDRLPVSHRQYAELFDNFKHSRGNADRPVTRISFEEARTYAKLRGTRLVRVDERQPALDTLGFVPAGMSTWEWVDDGAASSKLRPVRRVNDGKARRKPGGDKNTTFRLAQDLP